VAETVELQSGIDYVIIATSQVADAPYKELRGWIGAAVGESVDA
jgi:hypothetical protein